MSGHSTLRRKPSKPHPNFPLFPHATGRWAKKIRGKLYYFGKWDEPNKALALYLKQKDALLAGRTPRESPERLTLKVLANSFLNTKRARLDSGEIIQRTWEEYKTVCDLLIEHFGKTREVSDLTPEDFAELPSSVAAEGLLQWATPSNEYELCSKFAYDKGTLDRPIRYSQGFKRPSKKPFACTKPSKGQSCFPEMKS